MTTSDAKIEQKMGDLYTALDILRRLDSTMSAQQATVFLYVASHEGAIITDIWRALDLPTGSASRTLYALSAWKEPRVPGLGLIDIRDDPEDRRKRIVSLSPKGRNVAKAMLHAISS